MASNYIPNPDNKFDAWQLALIAWLSEPANMAKLSVSSAQLLPLTHGQGSWMGAYTAHNASQIAAKTDASAKDAARIGYEAILRPFIAALQLNPKLTDADRMALDITVPTNTRHSVAIPVTYPVPEIDFSMRLTHSVGFHDQLTPASKAKPAGVVGAQVWIKIGGPPPILYEELQFLATDTKTPYVHHFDMGDVGKVIYYALRWENMLGKVGPWSPFVSAGVPG